MVNELLIDFETAIGVKQQLDDLDRRIRVNANNIQTINNNINAMQSKLKKIDPNLIVQNYQNINSMKDSLNALQNQIVNAQSTIIDTAKRLNALSSKVGVDEQKIQDLYNKLNKQIMQINGLNDNYNKLNAMLNNKFNVYIDKNHSITMQGYAGLIQSLSSTSANNPFVVMNNIMQSMRKQIEGNLEQYIDFQISQLDDILHGYSINFLNMRRLGSSYSDLSNQLNNLYSKIKNVNTLSLSVVSNINNLKSILQKLNSAKVVKQLNFKDIMKIDTIVNNYINNITTSNTYKVQDFFNIDMFGIPIGKGHNPYVSVAIVDGDWTKTLKTNTEMPLSVMWEYINELIIDRMNNIISYSGINVDNHMKRQFAIIFNLIVGGMQIFKEIANGTNNPTYSKAVYTPDGKKAEVVITLNNVFASNIGKVMDSFAYPHLSRLMSGMEKVKGAFGYMKSYVPSSFYLDMPLNLNLSSNELNSPISIGISGNAIVELNAVIQEMKSVISNMKKDIDNIKNTMSKLYS